MTPSGIDSATFRFLAEWLNQLRHRVPYILLQWYLKIADKISTYIK
jgi:hypothetical protein